MSEKKISPSTVARIAGNILSGLLADPDYADNPDSRVVDLAVRLAREVVSKVERTEPK